MRRKALMTPLPAGLRTVCWSSALPTMAEDAGAVRSIGAGAAGALRAVGGGGARRGWAPGVPTTGGARSPSPVCEKAPMPPESRGPGRRDGREAGVTPAGNILVSNLRLSPSGKFLREVTPAGGIVRTLTVPAPTDERDIIVADNGDIDVFNGTFPALGQVLMSTYSATSGTWSSRTTANWSTVNNLTYGGVAAWGNYVFVTDMTT